jgi:hypothetical protein
MDIALHGGEVLWDAQDQSWKAGVNDQKAAA